LSSDKLTIKLSQTYIFFLDFLKALRLIHAQATLSAGFESDPNIANGLVIGEQVTIPKKQFLQIIN
jgi:hypothetical protein